MSIYNPQKTALALVDTFDDMLSEAGKLYSLTKETVEKTSMVKNIPKLLDTVNYQIMLRFRLHPIS
ncbi:hypothetical protein ACM55F_15435 [Flavobacterium sp. XS2P12]|uniref:hypothetical protein n=1 Tax=Flavobacterium melibiosi TaxID=3398734 RepID=UPI003A89D9CB